MLVCFCANKIDLYEYQEVNESIVNEYCNDNEYIFKETSAQNGHGIDVSKEKYNLIIIHVIRAICVVHIIYYILLFVGYV